MRDSQFIRNEKVPMTKEEIRYTSLFYLDIFNKKNMLDVGAGTGSCFIEALLQNKNIVVTAIESDDSAYNTIVENINYFDNKYKNIKNRVKLIKSLAPLVLEEKFECIFVGGTKGHAKNIISWCENLLVSGGVMVLNFITLENFYEAIDTIEKSKKLINIQGCQMQVNKIEKLAKYKYLKPHNPVFILRCEKI